MKSNSSIKRAFIAGADYKSMASNPKEEITYPNYGDAATVILEATEEETVFIDARYFIDSNPEGGVLTVYKAKQMVNIFNGSPLIGISPYLPLMN